MFKNVAAKFVVFAFDATTNVPKTGDAAQITAYVSKDYGTVTVLADTAATEFDATNAPGYYWFDAAQAETNADCLMVTAKSSTANIKVIGAPAIIYTRPTTGWLAPTVAGRTLDVSAGGEAGVDWANVGSPTTANALTSTTIATTQKVDVETIKTQTVTCAAGVTVLASVGTAATSTAQTGDSYARIGAPAGVSVSADVAAIQAKTVNLPAAPASTTNITAATGVTLTATTGLGNQTANITGTITTVTNLTNAPTAGDLTATMKASVNAEVVDALNVDTYAEPGQGSPAATATLVAKIGYIYKAWRNRSTQTATTYKLYADDATTVDQKAGVTDDATTFDRNEIATGP